MAVLIQCKDCGRKYSVERKKPCKCKKNLHRKGARYYVDYYLKNGKRRRELVGTDKKAALAADRKKTVDKFQGRHFEMEPQDDLTFAELSEWYFDLERVKVLKSVATIRSYVNKFNLAFGDSSIGDIRLADLENHQVRRKRDGMSPKTIDDEFFYTKSVLIAAYKNEMISDKPLKAFRCLKRKLKKGTNARKRYVSTDEFNQLYMSASRHFKPILVIGYWSGMRMGEILQMTWDQIDLKNRMIHFKDPKAVKEEKPKSIPMSRSVYQILRAMPVPIHTNRVILNNHGRPYRRDCGEAVKLACERGGIKYGRKIDGGMTFHDLRHSFIADMRKAGVHPNVVDTITGHAELTMNAYYDPITEQDQHDAVRLLEGWRLPQLQEAVAV